MEILTKSGIKDRNEREIELGDFVQVVWNSPFAEKDHKHPRLLKRQYKVIFDHGCFGIEHENGFTPLVEFALKSPGVWVPFINKTRPIISNNYMLSVV